MTDIWEEGGGAKFFISSGILFLALHRHIWSLVLLLSCVRIEEGGWKKGQNWLIVQNCSLNPHQQMKKLPTFCHF